MDEQELQGSEAEQAPVAPEVPAAPEEVPAE